MFAELGGALAGSGLAALLGPDAKKNTDQQFIQKQVGQMNSLLSAALERAISSSTGYTDKAVNQLNTSQNSAVQALLQALSQAQTQLPGMVKNATSAYQRTQGPWAKAGYDALDKYKQSLGMTAPVGGSAAEVQRQNTLFNNQQKAQSQQSQFNTLLNQALQSGIVTRNQDGTIAINNTAPNLDNIRSSVQLDPTQLNERVWNQYVNKYTPELGTRPIQRNRNAIMGILNSGQGKNYGSLAPFIDSESTAYRNELANQQYQAALSTYNTGMDSFNTGLNSLLSAGFNPQMLSLAKGVQ